MCRPPAFHWYQPAGCPPEGTALATSPGWHLVTSPLLSHKATSVHLAAVCQSCPHNPPVTELHKLTSHPSLLPRNNYLAGRKQEHQPGGATQFSLSHGCDEALSVAKDGGPWPWKPPQLEPRLPLRAQTHPSAVSSLFF